MHNHYTLYQFNALPDLQKTEMVEAEGVFLDITRLTPPFKVGLFSLHDFYVEVYYQKDKDSIANINAFTSMRRLERYLPAVDISAAIACLK